MANECPRISKIINHNNVKTVTFVDGSTLDIPSGFQADCIDGEWVVVPVLTDPPNSPVGSP
jgi:hypothetical protein